MYKKLVASAATVGILVFLMNAAAVMLYWYTAWWWFDMVMHTLGGVFVALIGAVVFYRHMRSHTNLHLFITLALFVFIVGLAWEYYEYIVQFFIKSVRLADVTDSISDLICDMVGGSIGILFVIWIKNRYNRE